MRLVLPLSALFLLTLAAQAQVTQPLVAVHDSELTRALETLPATSPTPTGAGTTGKQWWTPNWHYFVMPESVKEALRSDGTACTVIGDSNITAGLVLSNGLPKYPIVISLAAEAIRNDEIGPLTNYVAAGGFLLVGSSAFTRNPDGSTRGDFAFANAMGLHMVSPGLRNWESNSFFNKLIDHPLLSHIPAGQLTWRMPSAAEEISWGVSPSHSHLAPHDIWQVNATEASILASGDNRPYVAIRAFGKGCFIYLAAFQPLMGHGGNAPSMYAYGLLRKAIEWAFESANVPLPKLSPWPYPYDAAFTIRHDLENFQDEIANIEASALVEYTNGAKGDYYFCTGTLREEMFASYNTNAVIASLRRAVTQYQASVNPHNGGLKNPVNLTLGLHDYDYWHWGPDEALDVTPPGYASGKAYALASLSNSFLDVERWMTGLTNGLRSWVACYFNATREDSYEIEEQLGVDIGGDQKLTPFPHWNLSTRTPNKRYSFVNLPVSDWFVNGGIAQSLEPWREPASHTVQTLREGIDFYYRLGGLINFYSHTLSTGQGDAGQLVPEYIAYSLNTNLHPRLWSANAAGLYDWWVKRSQAQVTARTTISGGRTVTTLSIAGARDPETAVELVLPSAGALAGMKVLTNGVVAANTYRINGQVLKLRVGLSVTNAQIEYGMGGEAAFTDNFTRPEDPGTLPPWSVQAGNWQVTRGRLEGNAQTPGSYGYAYLDGSWANYAIQARLQFPTNSFGGGVAGCLNAATGARYAAWIYPEGSPGGSSVLKLLKFQSWNDFGYANTGFVPMQQVNLPGVGTNWHTLKLALVGAQLWVYYDGGLVLSATDAEPTPYSGGGVSVEMWADTPYAMLVDDVVVQPLAVADAYQVSVGTKLTVNAPGVLGNDAPLAGSNLTAVLVSPPTHGTLTLSSNGAFAYTPATNYSGEDSFTYRAQDGAVTLGTAQVTLTVAVFHLGPKLPAQTNRSIAELTALVVANTATNNDVPPTVLTYTLLEGPTNATIAADGVISWTPNERQGPGTNRFTTRVVDNRVPPKSDTNSFTVAVSEVNSPPVLPVQNHRAIGLQTLVVTNTATDPDWPANPLTYRLLTAPTNAAISINGIITWTPTAAQRGTHWFQTVVTDSNALAGSAQSLSATNSFSVAVDTTPTVVLESTSLVLEGCAPTNHAIDPGETVTMLFSFKNTGQQNTTNLVVRLLETNGVMLVSGLQTYGVLVAGGPAVSQPFTFAVTGLCGATITAALQLQEGGLHLGTASAVLPIGRVGTMLAQSFDTVAVPALPAGWSTAATGLQTNWVTTAANAASAPYSAFAASATGVGLSELVSPVIVLPAGTSQLSFRHSYDLESDTGTVGYDGAVLEIKLGKNGFVDILAAGGSFASGGYNRVIDTAYGNPLAGRQAWSGNSGGYVSAVVTLPSLPDQTMQLRWRCGSDNSTAKTGWRIDDIVLTGPACCQGTQPILPVQSTQTIPELSELVVTNTALNTGMPAGSLNYVLVEAPANAAISSDGVIRWTPGETQGPSTNRFTTVVTYEGAPPLKATNSFTVIVTEGNSRPQLPVQTNWTLAELTTLVVTNRGVDTDWPINTLSYTLLGPTNAQISAAGVITWTPTEAQAPSTNVLRTIVSDNGAPALEDVNTFVVVVGEVNSAPSLPIQPDRKLAGRERLVVTNTGSDADLPANSLTYQLVQAPAGASIDTNGVITWTPSVAQVPGSYVFKTALSDFNPQAAANSRLSVTNTFAVVVNAIHNGPVLPVLAEATRSELTTLRVTNTASVADVPAFALTYALIKPPAGATIDTNGVIVWTPTEAQGPSTNVLTTVVTDAGAPPLSATNHLTVIVPEQNLAPVLPVQPDQILVGLQPLLLTNRAADADWPVNGLTYQLLNPPAGAAIDTSGVITWTPVVAQVPGTYLLTTVVTDENPWAANSRQLSATNSFTVEVREIHDGPRLPVQVTRWVDELTPLVVTNTASNHDIPPTLLSYMLAKPPAGAEIDANGVITWTPNEGQGPSTNVFTTLVIDDVVPMASDVNQFTIIVNEVNRAPQLPVQADRSLAGFELLVVTNTATDVDLPANLLSYMLLTGPAGASIDARGVITWTPAPEQLPSTNVITTVVTDSSPRAVNAPQLSTTNRFTVVANVVHVGPVLPEVADQVIEELASLVVTNTATDTDMPYRTVSYALVDPPSGATIDTNGVITWTPEEGQGPSTNVFITVASDDGKPVLRDTNSFIVVVKEINKAPVLPAQPHRTLVGLRSLQVTNRATDQDLPANRLEYRLTEGPANSTIDANGLIAWTPTEAQGLRTHRFTTVVVDNGAPALSGTNSFSVEVTAAHEGPRFLTQPDRVVSEFKTLVVTNTAIDTDLPVLHLSYTLINPPRGASIDADGIITWTPDEEQGPSTNSFTTVVVDDGVPVLSAINHFTVVVTEENQAPVLPAQADRTIAELATLLVTNRATDADLPANSLSYALLNAPAGAAIDTNGVLCWTPSEAQGPGTYTLTTVGTDFNPWAANALQRSVTNSFTVTVGEVNRAPELPFQPERLLAGRQPLVVTNAALDPDLPANPLTYRLLGGPASAVVDTRGVITWVPALEDVPSTNLFTMMVTDNAEPTLSATNSFRVIVNFATNGPVMPPQPDLAVKELVLFCFTNAAIDYDVPVPTLSYRLLKSPAGMTIGTNGVITWTPTEVQGPGTNVVETAVSDSRDPALSATNRFVVVVQEVNSAPTPPVPADRTVPELSLLVVTNRSVDADVPANALRYALLNPPAGMSIDTNGMISWTPAEAQGPGTHVVTTVTTDSGVPALSATNAFTVTVTEVNSAPVLPVQADRIVAGVETLRVTNTASDADLPANVQTYLLRVSPTNAVIDANGVITWKPVPGQVPSSSRFEVVVTDNGVPALKATNSFTVFVTEPTISIQSVRVTNGMAAITWSALEGRRYRLQYTDSLSNPAWKDVVADLTAIGPAVTVTNAVEQASQRFYRVLRHTKEPLEGQ